MTFDARILTAPPQIGLPPEEDGPVTHVELIFQVLGQLPVGPGQIIPLPLGILRTGIDKATVSGLIDTLTEVREKMSDPPRGDLLVAQNMQQAEQVGRDLRGVVRP